MDVVKDEGMEQQEVKNFRWIFYQKRLMSPDRCNVKSRFVEKRLGFSSGGLLVGYAEGGGGAQLLIGELSVTTLTGPEFGLRDTGS